MLKLKYQKDCLDRKSACAATRNLLKNKIILFAFTIQAFLIKKMQKGQLKFYYLNLLVHLFIFCHFNIFWVYCNNDLDSSLFSTYRILDRRA